jgi:hypothetical protein
MLALTLDATCSGYSMGPYVALGQPASTCECAHVTYSWGESEECEPITPVYGNIAEVRR